ncbi:hypothetical protein Cantr_06924 [Candida viswanathii]|uniref:Uncharacterized protein n=1 Tax=Candida viswanathii TaxID=5486 RepID=A0A367XVE6_9ASCO|nr:hypothetical protein Cantr_06924 [Candida viswanathii]
MIKTTTTTKTVTSETLSSPPGASPTNFLKESFKKRYGNTYAITRQLLKGIRLDEILSLRQWGDLAEFVQQERQEHFDAQKRRATYLEKKSEIETTQLKLLRGRAKTVAESRHRRKQPDVKLDLKTPEGRKQFVLDGFDRAKYNGGVVLQWFVHEMQILLPYTREMIHTLGDNLDLAHIDGSSSSKALSQYDKDIVESILIPGLEYDLNKYYLDHKQKWLTQRGPYQAVVKETMAGVTPLPYVMQTTKHKLGRRELADLIKEQVLWVRIRNIWKAKEPIQEENVQKDGGYPVAKSGGWGPDEIIYPRKYYEQFCDGEELFEGFVEIANNMLEGNTDPIDFEQFYWGESLDIATEYINGEYRRVCSELPVDYMALLKQLQEKYNAWFEEDMEKYQKLVKDLEKYKQWQHHLRGPSQARYGQVPSGDRIGKGKSLGDFMKEAGFKTYEFGNKYTKRLTQTLRGISEKC